MSRTRADVDLRVHTWGTGPPIICLHGLGLGADVFCEVAAALGDRWTIVALDLPGSGFSPMSRPFSVDEATDALIDIIERVGPARPYVLGHSFGAIVALQALGRRTPPDRGEGALAPSLAGLIMVGGLPEPLPEARARIRARIDRVRREGLIGYGREVATANMAGRTSRERDDLVERFARRFERQDAGAYCTMAEALASWQAPPLPDFAGVPCLLVTGEEDRYAPPDAVRAFAARLPAGTRVEVLRDCGHLPFFERPETFAATIAATLDEWREARTAAR
jgi:3-oxoadipate enol-lactonase